ncbi:MAG: metal-sensitive transcriptional regulator [Sulfobacillus acidophilus]|uniref:Metal-sensitive transcriptional regulator n=1 Tax=Sulfobacillus acidophilus TaxID=53633 RepID=A0A2T2WG62_9FIRM|nr:MAG: metal-sensitive transcriptional regulator [Sulfobacillus acidophilus]
MTTRKIYWDREDLLLRLRRIEGQVRGVQAMIDADKSCESILVQVAAIEGALKKVSRIINACSVAERVAEISNTPDPTDAIKEALQDLIRYG